MKVREAIAAAAARLAADSDTPRLDAELLMAAALGIERGEMLLSAREREVPEDFDALVARRAAGEPVAYITGRRAFWTIDLAVGPGVLVPRPDTETVVEVARSLRTDRSAPCRVLDLCTGSGVLAVSLAKELPAAQVVATEVSPAAAAVARRNAERNGVADRVDVRTGDLWAPVTGEKFDLIVSNPPYIATSVISTLSPEVRREPVLALDGGEDGLRFYDRICAVARLHLEPGGALVVEHGFDQAAAVRERFETATFDRVTLVNDLAKNPRVTWGIAP